MFDDLVAKNNIDLPKNDIRFIKALIAGDSSGCLYVPSVIVHLVSPYDISRESDPPEKPFLFEIVANQRNGIDVDKQVPCIHLRRVALTSSPGLITLPATRKSQAISHRPSAQIGLLRRNITLATADDGSRLINCARVIEDQICYDIKDANMLFELCHTRYSLHKLIYTHKTGNVQTLIYTSSFLTTFSSPGNRVHAR